MKNFMTITTTFVLTIAFVWRGQPLAQEPGSQITSVKTQSKGPTDEVDQIREQFKHVIKAARDQDKERGIIGSKWCAVFSATDSEPLSIEDIDQNTINAIIGADNTLLNQKGKFPSSQEISGCRNTLLEYTNTIALGRIQKITDTRSFWGRLYDLLTTGDFYWWKHFHEEVQARQVEYAALMKGGGPTIHKTMSQQEAELLREGQTVTGILVQ